jgi:exonuclease III
MQNGHRVRFGSWNIHGLGKKLKNEDVVDSVNTLDFIAFLETWTTVQSNINFSGYGSFHQFRRKGRKRGRPNGGIVFFYKAKYKKYIVTIPSKHQDIMIVRVSGEALGHSKDMYILVVYVSPTLNSDATHNLFDMIENYLIQFNTLGDTLIMGDFNARTGTLDDYDNDSNVVDGLHVPETSVGVDYLPSRQNCDQIINTRGKLLLELCQATEHRILNGRFIGDLLGYFTFLAHNGSSSIDYILSNANLLAKVEYFRVSPMHHISDHCLLETCLKFNTPPCLNNQQNITSNLNNCYDRLQFNSDHRETYIMSLLDSESQNNLSHFLTNTYSPDSGGVQQAVSDFTSILVKAGRKSLKLKKGKRSDSTFKKTKNEWYDTECLQLRRDVNKLRGRLKTSPYSVEVRQNYLEKSRKYKKILKSKQRVFKDNMLTRLLQLADHDPKGFWNTLSKLHHMTGNNINPTENIPANEWHEHFKNIGHFQSKKSSFFKDSGELMKELRSLESSANNSSNDILDKPITINEIKKVVKNLKNNKASSDDMVLNEMLKYSSNITVSSLAKLFNLVFNSGIFPSVWNKNFQIPLFKGGDPLNCDNYRGISITSCLGKTFNAILAKRMDDFLDQSNGISLYQAAFRKKHGTQDHIFTLKSLINKYVRRYKIKLFCCFVDLRKAYDSIWRDGLFLKLRRCGVGGKFYNIIRNMYADTHSCVKLPNGITSSFSTKTGIKQGDNLSPVLFNIFIDDIVKLFDSTMCGDVSLCGTPVNSLLYADDLLIITTSPHDLQQSLDKLAEYCNTWKLEINTKKTKVIVFRPTKKILDYTFNIYGENVDIVNSITYLGISFSYTGNFTDSMKSLKLKGMRALFKLLSSLKSAKINNAAINIKLFDSTIKPILLYGSQVWGQQLLPHIMKADFGSLDRLPFEQIQNKLCKYSLAVRKNSSNIATRAELGRYPLLLNISLLAVKYWVTILSNPQKLVFKAYQEEKLLDEMGHKTWVSFVKAILSRCGLIDIWNNQHIINQNHFFKLVQSKLESEYRDKFFTRINSNVGQDGKSGNKLKTYSTIKKKYSIETYLVNNLPLSITQAIAKIRISAHDLEIERGWRKPNYIPRDERWCRFCKNQIEDELHFIVACPLYDNIRSGTLCHCNEFSSNESSTLNFVKLFCSNEKQTLVQLGNFIVKAFTLRKSSFQ